MAVEWTKKALRTIDEIAAYISQDNPARAISFVRELRDKTTKLETFPGMGRAGEMAAGKLLHGQDTEGLGLGAPLLRSKSQRWYFYKTPASQPL